MIGRQTFSQSAYAVCTGAGVCSALRWFNQRKLLILMYHQLHEGAVDPVENFDGLSVELGDFVRQMRYLARHYQVVPIEHCLYPEELTSRFRAVIAFDDAYASFYRLAYPVLRALNLPAAVFVPTDFIEGKIQMWWDRLRRIVSRTTERTLVAPYQGQRQVFPVRSQAEKQLTLRMLGAELRLLSESARNDIIETLQTELKTAETPLGSRHAPLSLAQMREMDEHRITFASHGKSHRSFPTLSLEELYQEIHGSKAILERWLGKPVSWLSYPFGDFDDRALNLLPQTGYEGAVTTIDGLNNGSGRFELRRVAVGGQTSFFQFVGATSGVREVASWLRQRFSPAEEVRSADPVY
jgi:peptidoglycan/xylan/chitin deacetylase (PgdA/CDA1 family)